jgi:hypothetical protein
MENALIAKAMISSRIILRVCLGKYNYRETIKGWLSPRHLILSGWKPVRADIPGRALIFTRKSSRLVGRNHKKLERTGRKHDQ